MIIIQKHSRDDFSFHLQRTDEVVERFILPVNASEFEPTGNRPSALGEECFDCDQMESPAGCRQRMLAGSRL